MKSYKITPVPKPRMTQRDKWSERPCVMRYRAFKDSVNLLNIKLPECNYQVLFVMPMPKSWSKKKRKDLLAEPHKQKPDKDNLEKALLDALYTDDSAVWDGRATKIWGEIGMIFIFEIDPPNIVEVRKTKKKGQ